MTSFHPHGSGQLLKVEQMDSNNDDLTFRKSTYCGVTTCVEVAMSDNVVLIRDSKNKQINPLKLTRSEWKAFLEGVRSAKWGFNI